VADKITENSQAEPPTLKIIRKWFKCSWAEARSPSFF